MKKRCIGILLATSLVVSQNSVNAETPFTGTDVHVTTDGGTVIIDGVAVPANAGSGEGASGSSYTVRSGDSLSAIAQKCLGNGNRYMEIVNLNAGRYPSLRNNPNLIYPGWTLTLPAGATSSPTPAPTTPSTPGSGESADLNAWKGGRLSPERFCALLGPVAAASFRATGVPASVTLAQAALETAWGEATIGDAKNLFGIKGTGPAGSVTVPNQEWENGGYITINSSFRKYNTWQESFDDHAELITTASRYANCLNYKNDPDQFARELQKAGYATDPEYANKLISIMRANNLYQYDK